MSFCTGSVLRVNTKDTESLLGDDRFMALEQQITIIPKITSDEPVDCIMGNIGPFRAHTPLKVPMWAALEMARVEQCTIDPPPWLHVEELKRLRDEERDPANADRFMPVDEHYLEVAFALLAQAHSCKGSMFDSRQTVLLIREIIELRRKKIIAAIEDFTPQSDAIFNVTNMSSVELSCFRARSLLTLDTFLDLMQTKRVLERNDEDDEDDDPPVSQMEDSSNRL